MMNVPMRLGLTPTEIELHEALFAGRMSMVEARDRVLRTTNLGALFDQLGAQEVEEDALERRGLLPPNRPSATLRRARYEEARMNLWSKVEAGLRTMLIGQQWVGFGVPAPVTPFSKHRMVHRMYWASLRFDFENDVACDDERRYTAIVMADARTLDGSQRRLLDEIMSKVAGRESVEQLLREEKTMSMPHPGWEELAERFGIALRPREAEPAGEASEQELAPQSQTAAGDLSCKTESATTAEPAQEPRRKPGRPSLMYLIDAELERRGHSKTMYRSLAREAAYQAKWITRQPEAKPPGKPPSAKSIANHIRNRHRELKAGLEARNSSVPK